HPQRMIPSLPASTGRHRSGTDSIYIQFQGSHMGTPRMAFAGVAVLTVLAGVAPAQIISFEGFAPPGGLVNINPTLPSIEAGYQFLPLNASSAVFDSAAMATMTGNPSDWFGFAGGNTITLTRLSGPPFSLTSLLAGPSSIGLGNPTTLSLVGNVVGGG